MSLGQGVAVVPESVVGRLELPQVNYRRLHDCQPRTGLALVHRRFEKSPAVTRYLERVRASLA
ncbi:MAG: hypothetical protein GAK45_01250 [Pseudomonas citronellolis]|nr:MAG: hypothetical protein GAK45_01250 [Pseudomonas citronellolis]